MLYIARMHWCHQEDHVEKTTLSRRPLRKEDHVEKTTQLRKTTPSRFKKTIEWKALEDHNQYRSAMISCPLSFRGCVVFQEIKRTRTSLSCTEQSTRINLECLPQVVHSQPPIRIGLKNSRILASSILNLNLKTPASSHQTDHVFLFLLSTFYCLYGDTLFPFIRFAFSPIGFLARKRFLTRSASFCTSATVRHSTLSVYRPACHLGQCCHVGILLFFYILPCLPLSVRTSCLGIMVKGVWMSHHSFLPISCTSCN